MLGTSQVSQNPEDSVAWRSVVRGDLTGWAAAMLAPSGQQPAGHHRLLLNELESISRGESDRLMVLMPPGSAKSTYASILFPTFWFTQHPDSSVIATSHTSNLARHLGRQVQSLVIERGSQLGYSLRTGRTAAADWSTSTGGTYFAAGVRGPLTGRRADLVIIDDPIKSQAEADSPVMRERLWGWYRSDVIPRLKPKGRVILVMTRWHEDDLAGRLLAQSASEWHLIRLPALAGDNDELGRPEGTALWPEWEDEAALQRKRDVVGQRTWSALYQQRPGPLQGSLFKTDRIEILDAMPASTGHMVRAWDLAASVATGINDPDWTVGIKFTRSESDRYVVLDIVRMRGSPRDVEDAIVRTARLDGQGVRIGLPEDPGQAGKSQVAYLVSHLAGNRVSASPETGAKATRAAPVASQMEAGNLAMVRGGWNYAFLNELQDYPFGRKDDQVDALSRAFNMLTPAGASARHISVPYLAR